jgi:AraC family L-rhamnose operon regulatory protein RhaS
LKVLFIISGEGRLLAGKNEWRLEKSALVAVPPRIAHRIADEPGAPLSIYVLCVEGIAPFGDLREFQADCPTQVRDGEIVTLAGTVMRRLLIEKARMLPGRRLMTAGLAAILLGRMARCTGLGGLKSVPAKPGAQANVERYRQGLATAFGEPDTLDSVARRLGLSRRRFTQLFREISGESWLPYLRRLRVEHAKHLLRNTDRSIAAVAFECGFEDLSNFYRAFKAATGQPPRGWRERHRKV